MMFINYEKYTKIKGYLDSKMHMFVGIYGRQEQNKQNDMYVWIMGSSGSGEAYDFCVLSEAFSAEEQVVLSDETHLAFAVSALSAVFSEFSCVGSPE